ncbi:geraniol dehydrogenase 1 isoform X1 [Lingula anatina]|uniref:Geraniol dehydrogenase 1 isoform X1 n=2 Tax=Lingula anatina TaxID=7574 RepID=A0A1S3HZN3_LINAN|nr:geraniol dehydrogenase 1 isoform X1 [Lingula anatina]|eukprot:XP_013391475.1 geraniol dehydrogenase 1 isoform X1 [Lingula anatina]
MEVLNANLGYHIAKFDTNNMSRSAAMFCLRSGSIEEKFDYCPDTQIPSIPPGGAVVKICYAGACYTEDHMIGHHKNLTPGFEVAGIIHGVCPSVPNANLNIGDRVIVFPEEHHYTNTYYDYITVKDVNNLIVIPPEFPMEVAAMLPCGGLTAYNAVMRAKPIVEYMLQNRNCVNILIVGAGGLGLWTIKLAKALISGDCNRVHITVADTSIDKLLLAQDHGCYDVIHWNDADHEQYLIERTLDVCRGGVDLVIDYVSSPRTFSRTLQVLNREGVVIVGGNCQFEISICLNTLAQNQQSIVGLHSGTVNQLRQLVELLTAQKVTPPTYATYPITQASQVFKDLNECKILGRAVLQVSAVED